MTTETKHTPKLFKVKDESRKEREEVVYLPGESFGVYSCKIEGDTTVWTQVAAECSKEDATLFAASGQMLDALKTLQEHDLLPNDWLGKLCRDAIVQAGGSK